MRAHTCGIRVNTRVNNERTDNTQGQKGRWRSLFPSRTSGKMNELIHALKLRNGFTGGASATVSCLQNKDHDEFSACSAEGEENLET